MARKKGEKTPPEAPEPGDDGARKPDHADQAVDQSPEVRAAEEAVSRAEAELRKARELYEKVRHQAADRLKEVREKTVGDIIDGTLRLVKKHPGPSVVAAAVLGYFLGRLWRR